MNNHRVEMYTENSMPGRFGSAGLGSWLFGIAMTMVLALGAGIETVRAQAIESPVDLLERESNKVLKLLRQHVSGFEIRNHKDVRLPGDRRLYVLDLGSLQIDGIIERQRPVKNTASDLPPVGHLAKCGGINRRDDLRRDGFNRGQDRDFRRGDTEHM